MRSITSDLKKTDSPVQSGACFSSDCQNARKSFPDILTYYYCMRTFSSSSGLQLGHAIRNDVTVTTFSHEEKAHRQFFSCYASTGDMLGHEKKMLWTLVSVHAFEE